MPNEQNVQPCPVREASLWGEVWRGSGIISCAARSVLLTGHYHLGLLNAAYNASSPGCVAKPSCYIFGVGRPPLFHASWNGVIGYLPERPSNTINRYGTQARHARWHEPCRPIPFHSAVRGLRRARCREIPPAVEKLIPSAIGRNFSLPAVRIRWGIIFPCCI